MEENYEGNTEDYHNDDQNDYPNYQNPEDERLDEIGRLLFQDGAFFSSMTEEEKNLFGEALGLFAVKAANKVVDERCNCDAGSNDDLGQSVKEVLDFVKGGFNVNVNVTPNYQPGCGCNGNYPGAYPEKDQYYTNNPDEMINDGTYNPGPDEEMMYGTDMPMEPKDEYYDPSMEPPKDEEPPKDDPKV